MIIRNMILYTPVLLLLLPGLWLIRRKAYKGNGGAAVPVTCDRKERSLCTGNTAADLSKARSASDPAPLSLHRL